MALFLLFLALYQMPWGPHAALWEVEGTVEHATLTLHKTTTDLNFTLTDEPGRFVGPAGLMHVSRDQAVAMMHPGEHVKVLFDPSDRNAAAEWGLTAGDTVLLTPADVTSDNRRDSLGMFTVAVFFALAALYQWQKERRIRRR